MLHLQSVFRKGFQNDLKLNCLTQIKNNISQVIIALPKSLSNTSNITNSITKKAAQVLDNISKTTLQDLIHR